MKTLGKFLASTALLLGLSAAAQAQNANPQYGPGPVPCGGVACSVTSLLAGGATISTGMVTPVIVAKSATVSSDAFDWQNHSGQVVGQLGENSAGDFMYEGRDHSGTIRLVATTNGGLTSLQLEDVNGVSSYLTENTGGANFQLGLGDIAGAPTAQTLSVQSAAGVSNQAGANTVIDLSAGTGTGIAGTATINGAPHSTTGTTKNAYSALIAFNGDTLQTITSTGGTAALPALAILNGNTGLYSTSTGTNLGEAIGGVVKVDYAITTAATWTLAAATTINNATFKVTTLGVATAVDTVCYASATGLFTEEPTGTTCTVSARRFKRDIKYLSSAAMLNEVLGMKPVSFRFKKGVGQDDGAEVHYGLIAEDVEKVAPELVAYEKDGQTHGVKYGDGELTSHLIGAIKAEQAEIDQMKHQIARLERRK